MNEKRSCYLCGNKKFKKREGKVRDNPNIDILQCSKCGLVFLSNFDHITDSFYEESNMHENDIAIEEWLKETAWDDERRLDYLRRTIENKHVLDFGCGNGGFIMRARDYASLIEGVEVERCLEAHFKNNKLHVYKTYKRLSKSMILSLLFTSLNI